MSNRPKEDTFNTVITDIQKEYQPEAQLVVDQLNVGNACLVAARSGYGKSSFLLSNIKHNLDEQKKKSSYFIEPLEFFDRYSGLKSGRIDPKVVIIDEFQCPVSPRRNLARTEIVDLVVSKVVLNRKQLILMGPPSIPASSINVQESIDLWQESWNAKTGNSIPELRLDFKEVPTELARRYLEGYAPKLGFSLNIEEINTLLSYLPHRINLLHDYLMEKDQSGGDILEILETVVTDWKSDQQLREREIQKLSEVIELGL